MQTIDTHLKQKETSLIKRSLAGDGAAFSELVRPHLPVMVRVAHRHTGDRSMAEDAVQESLTKVFSELRRYKPGTSFRAWFAAITTQVAFTLRRSENRRIHRERTADIGQNSFDSTESEVRAQELEAHLREVLAAMPAKRREAATLRLDAQLSYAEIAQALDTSENSARVMVHMAMKELKEKVRRWNETGEMEESGGGS